MDERSPHTRHFFLTA